VLIIDKETSQALNEAHEFNRREGRLLSDEFNRRLVDQMCWACDSRSHHSMHHEPPTSKDRPATFIFLHYKDAEDDAPYVVVLHFSSNTHSWSTNS